MLFDEKKLLIIAGPCALESAELLGNIAKIFKAIEANNPEIQLIFKTSFDKANRTSATSKRGVGLEKGLEILQDFKAKYNFTLTTDIHLPEHAARVAGVVDVVQIPAFLCRQTDILQAAAEIGKVVSVKKGQFLSPYEMKYVVEKLQAFGAKEIWQMDRGTTFGYNNLVVDMRNFEIMKRFSPVAILDATHSVQMPGAGDGKTLGNREFAETLAYAALSAGANGLFFEVHTDPDRAICDAANQIHANKFEGIVKNCLQIWRSRRDFSKIY